MICHPNSAITVNLRRRMNKALRGELKVATTKEFVGCSMNTLREHLENQFQEGMSWDNYGEWHIDHRRPCASFNLALENEQKMCFHYTNLQPMWGAENISKNDSFDEANFDREWDGSKWVEKK